MTKGIFDGATAQLPRLLAFAILAVIAVCGCNGQAMGQQANGYEEPPVHQDLPIVIETSVGGHRLKATINSKTHIVKDYEKSDLDGCFYADVMMLSVSRDGKVAHIQDYCSVYNIAWAAFHADANDVPYLFVGFTEGRGSRMNVKMMRIYRLGERLASLADIVTSRLVSLSDDLYYGYRVRAPQGGGLLLDMRATRPKNEPGCCDEWPVFQQFRFDPERPSS